MVAAFTADIHPIVQNRVVRHFNHTLTIEPVENPNSYVANPNFRHNYAVLRMWQQTQFSRLVVVDADMLVTQSLDRLCEMRLPDGGLAAANNWWTSRRNWDLNVFNAGLMVISPSNNTFRKLMLRSKSFHSKSGGVQPLLNDVFKGKLWKRLDPFKWGMNANAYDLRRDMWNDLHIHAIHYTNKAKPCHTSVGQFFGYPLNHPYVEWHRAHEYYK